MALLLRSPSAAPWTCKDRMHEYSDHGEEYITFTCKKGHRDCPRYSSSQNSILSRNHPVSVSTEPSFKDGSPLCVYTKMCEGSALNMKTRRYLEKHKDAQDDYGMYCVQVVIQLVCSCESHERDCVSMEARKQYEITSWRLRGWQNVAGNHDQYVNTHDTYSKYHNHYHKCQN